MTVLRPVGLVLLLCAGIAHADGNAVYQRQGDDGSVELTNIPDGSPNDFQAVAVPPAAPAVVAAPKGAAAAPQKHPSISGGPMGDTLRQLYNGARAAHEAGGR